jgi:hypothetical protein
LIFPNDLFMAASLSVGLRLSFEFVQMRASQRYATTLSVAAERGAAFGV